MYFRPNTVVGVINVLYTFVGMNVVFGSVFLTVGGFFLYADLYQKPKWLMKYKTQVGTNTPVSELQSIILHSTPNS